MLSTHRGGTRFAGLLVVAIFVFAACSNSSCFDFAERCRVDPGVGTRVADWLGTCFGGGLERRRRHGSRSSPRPRPRAASRPSPCRTTWCNYGEMLIDVHAQVRHPDQRAQPDGSSGDEIEAIKANKDNPGPQAPDVVDVGLGFGRRP